MLGQIHSGGVDNEKLELGPSSSLFNGSWDVPRLGALIMDWPIKSIKRGVLACVSFLSFFKRIGASGCSRGQYAITAQKLLGLCDCVYS